MEKKRLTKSERRELQEKLLKNRNINVNNNNNVENYKLRRQCSMCDNSTDNGLIMKCPRCNKNFCIREHWHDVHIIYMNIYICMSQEERTNELIRQITENRPLARRSRTKSENDIYIIPQRSLHRK